MDGSYAISQAKTHTHEKKKKKKRGTGEKKIQEGGLAKVEIRGEGWTKGCERYIFLMSSLKEMDASVNK
jgi:hypothetical protein